MKNCWNCSAKINDNEIICPECGERQYDSGGINLNEAKSEKTRITPGLLVFAKVLGAIILCFVALRIGIKSLPGRKSSSNDTSQSSYNAASQITKKRYNIRVRDKYILESDSGEYTLVVSYNYENSSDKPQCFAWACQDQVFLDGIECDKSYDDYSGKDTNFGTYVQRDDDILSGKSAIVNVGYDFSKFKPESKQEVLVRISEALDSKSVLSETKIKASDIRIVKDKRNE